MSILSRTFPILLALDLAACAADDNTVDELGDDFEPQAASDVETGKADDFVGPTTQYFQVRPDFRKCASPMCGGAFVHALNKALTKCANGTYARECYTADIDWTVLGLDEAKVAEARDAFYAGKLLVRGAVRKTTAAEGIGGFGRLSPSQAWVANGDGATANGVFVRVQDNGIRCMAYPCNNLHEDKLNSTLSADMADLDFDASCADEDQIADAQLATMQDGLIVAGSRYYVHGAGGTAKARTVNEFWTRLVPDEAPTSPDVRN